MNRRTVLKSSAALLAAPFLHIRPVRADKGELVVVSWGGDYDTAIRDLAVPAFQKNTGYTVKMDAPPENAKVKAMVQSGNVGWDVILTDIPAVLTLTKDTLLEPLDYGAIDKAKLDKIPKELQQPYAIGQRIYSFNIVYNTNALPKPKHPRDWAEVWDQKHFPGGRTFNFQGGIEPQLEVALLADGVPVDKLYPLDIERAWKMFDKLRPLVSKWYTSHAQAIQLIGADEASVGCTIGPRGITAKHAGAPIDVDYNQGKLASDNWCLVKGVRDKKIAMEFINQALDPKVQAGIAQRVPYGPSNGGAFEFLSASEAADLNTSPDNIKEQFWQNVQWWSTPGADGKTPREAQAERFAKWMVAG
ncbi:MAG: ABC transporter substrate-binding protein [Acidisphaera sp.]|nr:ABC transporter substrate-binding protein [Acidisphaera sp.]